MGNYAFEINPHSTAEAQELCIFPIIAYVISEPMFSSMVVETAYNPQPIRGGIAISI